MTETVMCACDEIVAELGECPWWDVERQELTWVDIPAGRIYRARVRGDSLTLVGSLALGCSLGTAAPAERGGWLVAADTGFAWCDESGGMSWIARPEAPPVRMNDGACDARGRFWAGSTAGDEVPGAGSVYRLDPDLSVRRMIGGSTISNGIGWSADNRTMWFADSGPGTVDAWDYDLNTGTISARRTIIAIDPAQGTPDGLAVDDQDHLWVAVWDGSELRRYDGDGRLRQRIPLPVTRPTSCCFGGDDLATLFVTSAREGLSEQQLRREPHAGRLLALRPGARGVPMPRFAGL